MTVGETAHPYRECYRFHSHDLGSGRQPVAAIWNSARFDDAAPYTARMRLRIVLMCAVVAVGCGDDDTGDDDDDVTAVDASDAIDAAPFLPRRSRADSRDGRE